MRIVIDMQGAQTESRFRGIGRYTLSFAQAVVRNRGENEVFLVLNGLLQESIDQIRSEFDGIISPENIRIWHALNPIAESVSGNNGRREVAEIIREAFIQALNPDIIHVCSLMEGYLDDAATSIGVFDKVTPVSVALYDLIPLLNPDDYLLPNPEYAKFYRRKIGYLNKASCLLAISEFSRQEGVNFLEKDESSIVNVSTAIDEEFARVVIDEDEATQFLAKFGVTRDFLLYTGGADERKNLPRLVEAYAKIPKRVRDKFQLLLAGKMSENSVNQLQSLAKNFGLNFDELCFSGYVTDQELVRFYSLCRLFVFPSWHEGFGLPVLEAMTCGAPVIAANTSSLPEVIGLESAYFDPFDVGSISEKILQALEDQEFSENLRQHGIKQASRFSWDETARKSIEKWQRVVNDRSTNERSRQKSRSLPRLAFVSPLPPQRTGIADYSAELLPSLMSHYDVTVIVSDDFSNDRHGSHGLHVKNVAWLRENSHEIDRVVYQLGNSPFHYYMLPLIKEIPGTIVLHDFYLSNLMAWSEINADSRTAWATALYISHGYTAVRDRYVDADAAKVTYPANFDVLRYAQGIIVHSNFSIKLGNHWYEGYDDLPLKNIPLVRSSDIDVNRSVARAQLKMADDDFLVCSFGFLDATKYNDRLLKSFIESDLFSDPRCKLHFVGENNAGEYGGNLLRLIEIHGLKERVKITGFASREDFRRYLASADLAVQLRNSSRGETSASILDCMNFSLPVIANANGAISELDDQSIYLLQDFFEKSELVDALHFFWKSKAERRNFGARARESVLKNNSPEKCAHQYFEAIEGFYKIFRASVPKLIDAISGVKNFSADENQLIQLSKAVDLSVPLPRPVKRLFIDVTATCRNDLKTGIERVTRAILFALLESPPVGYRIEPVYLSNAEGGWCYRYARKFTLELLDCPLDVLHDDVADPQCGDVLVGLDLAGSVLINAAEDGVFTNLRDVGVRTFFLVHDLLPARMPQFFPPGAEVEFKKWLDVVARMDGAICTTNTVLQDLSAWRSENKIELSYGREYRIGYAPLGADMDNSFPSQGLDAAAESILKKLETGTCFLMVGTIEPRKGHLEVIDAFEELWASGEDIFLVIVGREGWRGLSDEYRRNIPLATEKIRNHPELNKRLFWLDGISDEFLEKVYEESTCLIAASFGEGFGLPLIEAAQKNIPIIARDIPVFREVAGDHAFYFSNNDADNLAMAVRSWMQLKTQGKHPKSESMTWSTWRQSAENVSKFITAS